MKQGNARRAVWATVAVSLAATAQARQSGPAPGEASGVDAQFLKQVNAVYETRERAVPREQRTDLVLLPAIAAMDVLPGGLTALRAALMTPTSPGWADVEKWSMGEKQRGAIGALMTVGEPGKRWAFNQGYGRDAADPAVREPGLYTSVGDPPILGAARFGHLAGLDRLGALAQFEATRLAFEKKGKSAADVLVRWIILGRQMADREFYEEKRWGAHAMVMGFERLRDLAHAHPASFTDVELQAVIADLDAKHIARERIMMPQGDRLAAEQVIARAFVQRGGANPETFGPTMAKIASAGAPLARFGEAARWQELASSQANTFDAVDAVRNAFNDWDLRWKLDPFDPLLQKPSDHGKWDRSKFAALETIVGKVERLFDLRRRVGVEWSGTRIALALVAFQRKNGQWAPAISSPRPLYIAQLDPDPFDPRKGDFHYFVPIRDQPRAERELPKPHVIRVGLPGVPLTAEDAAVQSAVEKLSGAAVEEIKATMTSVIATLVNDRNETAAREKLSAGPATTGAKPMDGVDPGALARATVIVQARAAAARASVQTRLDALLKEIANGTTQNGPAKADEIVGAIGAAMAPVPMTGGFEASVDQSMFVLYSRGPNQAREWARSVGEQGTDILVFPPVLSLARDAAAQGKLSEADMAREWLDYEPARLTPSAPEADSASGRRESGTSESPSPGRPRLPSP